MLIEVHHVGHDFTAKELTHVATVTVPDETEIWRALEYAYRWTNNVDGSWSIKQPIFDEGTENGDFNPAVEVIAPLRIDPTGKAWGHRSSMMGDIFIVDAKRYCVAAFGFEEVAA